MTYLRKQVIQNGKIVYQDFSDGQSSIMPTHQPSNPGHYPAYNDYPDYQQTPAFFPPPVQQPPAAPLATSVNNVQETEVVTSAIYIHPFVWLFGLVFFAVCMTGLLRPAVIVPYGGGGNTYIMPGSGGQ